MMRVWIIDSRKQSGELAGPGLLENEIQKRQRQMLTLRVQAPGVVGSVTCNGGIRKQLHFGDKIKSHQRGLDIK